MNASSRNRGENLVKNATRLAAVKRIVPIASTAGSAHAVGRHIGVSVIAPRRQWIR